MKTYLKTLKRWDFIIVFFLVFISFLPIIIFSYIQAGKVTPNSENVAVISVNNQEVERITLTNHEDTEILDIPEIPCDPNTVEVKNNEIRIRTSTCPEQICIQTGFISKPGQAIICLPHKVLIEVQTVEGYDEEIIISS